MYSKKDNGLYYNEKNWDDLYADKYVLMTMYNENGKLIFQKKRNGNEYDYYAKNDVGRKIFIVNKAWILANKNIIVNLGVSGDRIYPVNQLKLIRNTRTEKINCSGCDCDIDSEYLYKFKTSNRTIYICPDCYSNIIEDKRSIFYGEMRYTIDKDHPDCQYIKNWSEDFVCSDYDVCRFDGGCSEDYYKEMMLEYFVEGLDYYDHCHNLEFRMERLRI